MTLFSDGVSRALDQALDGVALRQRVVSQNISNAMTPGYQAQSVAFESALASAVREGDPGAVRPEVLPTGDFSREDGNNVRLEDEAALLLRSGLQYDALVQASNYRHKIYSTALSR
ncbi:MAG: flagellar biosynthesis protein FlgB [Actinomycetota bacterium]|nr:flagellar biosynthesis protein FlgB [Actinomycetota bacterium]